MRAARFFTLVGFFLALAPPAGSLTHLVLLGTGGGTGPYATRAQPANALYVDGTVYLVDCGNGVGAQMRLAGLAGNGLRNLRHIFLTHHHLDHMADLVTLPLLAWEYLEQPITLHGPKPLKKAVKHGLKQYKWMMKDKVDHRDFVPFKSFLEVHQFKKDGVVLDDEHVTVTAAHVDHGFDRPAYAYRFDTKNEEAKSIVFSGDTAPSEALVALAQGADILVHEVVTVTPEELVQLFGLPLDDTTIQHILRYHTSFRDVGRIASDAGVGTLVLSPVVPADHVFDEAALRAEIAKSFAGEVVFGEDLMQFTYPAP